MKILQVSPHFIPAFSFGGVLQAVHAMSVELVSQGHEVHVATTNLATRKECLNVPVSDPVLKDGLTIYYEPIVFSGYWGFSPALKKRLREQVSWADVVFVHFHYQYASWAGARECRRQQRPYVLFTHGSLRKSSIEARSLRKKHFYLELLEKENIQQALFLAFQSSEELEESLFSSLGQVVPNGVTLPGAAKRPPKGAARRELQIDDQDLMLLFMGRLAKGKGLELLLPAFHALLQKRPDSRLVLAGAGEGGFENLLQKQVDELGLTQSVIFPGLITGLRKEAMLNDADMFVLPSRSEGLSIAMLEAMGAGLPVVVTDRVGLWRTIESERCGLVSQYAVEELTSCLIEMATSSEREEIGRRGERLVKNHYGWPVVVKDFVQLVNRRLP